MKKKQVCWMGVLLCLSTVAVAADAPLTTYQDQLSYSMGIMTGRAFKSHGVTVNTAIFAKGLNDGLTGRSPALSEEQIRNTLLEFQKKSMQQMKAQMKTMAEQNKKSEQAFFATNAKNPEVKTTASGLQYTILQAGQGASPTINDTVTVNYEGKLLNGTVFDSSYQRGEPTQFPVKDVIKGWQEALMMMQPGATWEVYVPAKLGYGDQGAPGVVGPSEALIFKINLISVQPSTGPSATEQKASTVSSQKDNKK
ncbi:MAG: hypothetical protein A3F41_01095 [Coxiella sp. RIFCSPHIGHO2_12_FULL_44_14]|nr:MAG: hypothetical protein A3F41_01095 [Coxiella sp. RIFCSPHIGHO2_12_FULL_44_14]